MYAMQYQIALPADYDMDVIRKRVRATGRLMDGFPGLEFKAYLMQEKAEGAPRNAYAPFYVWRDTDGMRSFCWGEPGYSSIVRDFGRHSIQDWTVHRFAARLPTRTPAACPFRPSRFRTTSPPPPASKASRPHSSRKRTARPSRESPPST